jgi:hypothetical protein
MQHYTLLKGTFLYRGNQGKEAGHDHRPDESFGHGGEEPKSGRKRKLSQRITEMYGERKER